MFDKLREQKSFKTALQIFIIAFWFVVINLAIWIVIAFVSSLLHDKNFMDGFIENIKISVPLISFLVIIICIGLIILLSIFLINKAIKNEKGKISIAIQSILVICIFYVVAVVLSIIVSGLLRFFKESFELFITFLCCVAFIFYYWYRKKIVENVLK
jgi:hypothetical protein